MSRKNPLKIQLILVFLLYMSLILSSCGKGNTKVRLGTGDTGGTYYAYSAQLDELLKDDLTIQLKTTMGSEANLNLLQKGFLDAALVQSDSLYRAEMLREDDENNTAETRNYSAAAGLYTELFQIVVRKDSDIKTVADLSGKNVSFGADESGVRQNAFEILNAIEYEGDDMIPHYLSLTDSAEALKQGTIDAFFCMAGAPTEVLTDLAATTGIRLLSLDEESIHWLMKQYPYYMDCTIPEGTYPGQTTEIHTVGVRAVFVVSNSMDASSVKMMTEKLITNSGSLNSNIVTDGQLSAADAVAEVTIPFHRGAAEYLKDQGVEVEVELSSKSGIVFGSQDSEGGTK